MAAVAPVTGKIVLKSTTTTSLNDRFTQVMVKSKSKPKTGQIALTQASLKNQRLAEQMAKRTSSSAPRKPTPITSPPPRKSQPTLKSRLSATSKSPKSRLGVVRPGGGGIVAASPLPLMSATGSSRPWQRNTPVGRSPGYASKPYAPRGSWRGRGRGLSVARGGATHQSGRGGGRGTASRGRGQGQPSSVPKSKGDLDKELDAYMIRSSKS